MKPKLFLIFFSTFGFVLCVDVDVDIPSGDVLPPFAENSPPDDAVSAKAVVAKTPSSVSPKKFDSSPRTSYPSGADASAEVLRHVYNIAEDGSYQYAYETSNGIQANEEGVLKLLGGNPPETAEQVQGAFSYVAPDGQQINVQYVANENGFQPSGEHLPTPPPTPDAILRALQYIQSRSV